PEPIADGRLPRITGEARVLLHGRERFELQRFEVPGMARLVEVHRLGPQLVAHRSKAVDVDPTDAGDRPKSSRASRVAQVAAIWRRVDRGGEYALSREVDRVLAPGRTVALVAAGYECVLRRHLGAQKRVQFGKLDDEDTREFDRCVLGADVR